MPGRKGKVLVAMSGGVDSSVAAALLLRDGYEPVGCFMRLGSPDEEPDRLVLDASSADACTVNSARRDAPPGGRGCCSVGDARDARTVAGALGMPMYVVNFRREFGRIMDYFVAEHQAGRTPNPCVRCNDWLKFGRLHEYAAQIGADFVATGHHARIVTGRDGPELHRGADAAKDQSYVLFGSKRDRLGRMLLPVGEMNKSDVRAEAARLGLPTFDKPDSQEICFVPDDDHAAFVERRAPGLRKTGAIVDTAGRTIGEHTGHHRFTIGQRRGVGVALGRPIYVVEKRPDSNTIVVGDADDLAVVRIDAGEANWLVPTDRLRDIADRGGVLAQHRAHGATAAGRLELAPDGESFTIKFESPITGVAPGQAVVCYDPDEPGRCLGGGWITRARSRVSRVAPEPPESPGSSGDA